MASHSSILAWEIPWTEEPVRLKSTGLQTVRHNWVTNRKMNEFPGEAAAAAQGSHFENPCPRLWLMTLHKLSSINSQSLGARLVDFSLASAQVVKYHEMGVLTWPSGFSYSSGREWPLASSNQAMRLEKPGPGVIFFSNKNPWYRLHANYSSSLSQMLMVEL